MSMIAYIYMHILCIFKHVYTYILRVLFAFKGNQSPQQTINDSDNFPPQKKRPESPEMASSYSPESGEVSLIDGKKEPPFGDGFPVFLKKKHPEKRTGSN